MTNIVEIVSQLNKEHYNIDMIISEDRIFIVYQQVLYDTTTMGFADQIRLIANILNAEIFG